MIKIFKTSLIAFLVFALVIFVCSCKAASEENINNDKNTVSDENIGDDVNAVNDEIGTAANLSASQLIEDFFSSDEQISEGSVIPILSCYIEYPTEMLSEFNKLSPEQQRILFPELCSNLNDDNIPQFEDNLYDLSKKCDPRGEKLNTLQRLQSVYTESSIFSSLPHIRLYDPFTRWESWILLQDGEVTKIKSALEDDSSKILLGDYADTAEYFFAMDIMILLPGGNLDGNILTEYSILTNEQGEKILMQNSDDGNGFLATEECNNLIAIISDRYGWNYITMSQAQIHEMEKAELLCNKDVLAEITDRECLDQLGELFSEARCIGYVPQTMMYGPQLQLTRPDGSTVCMYLDLENDLVRLPVSFHYDYGPGMEGTDSINNLPRLLNIFGFSAWPEEVVNADVNSWILE